MTLQVISTTVTISVHGGQLSLKINDSCPVDSYRCGCNDKCPWWTVIVDGQLSVLQSLSPQCFKILGLWVLEKKMF